LRVRGHAQGTPASEPCITHRLRPRELLITGGSTVGMRLRRDEVVVSETENQRRDVLDDVLHFGAGFKDGERRWVLGALSALGPHLARWDPDDVDVEISVKDRDGREQHVTLRADLPGYAPLVAVVADRNLDRALAAAKREMIRQIEDQKSMREPKHNRQLRKKIT
jgi:hypothetical protein